MEKGFIIIKPETNDEEFEKIMQFLELAQKEAAKAAESERQ